MKKVLLVLVAVVGLTSCSKEEVEKDLLINYLDGRYLEATITEVYNGSLYELKTEIRVTKSSSEKALFESYSTYICIDAVCECNVSESGGDIEYSSYVYDIYESTENSFRLIYNNNSEEDTDANFGFTLLEGVVFFVGRPTKEIGGFRLCEN